MIFIGDGAGWIRRLKEAYFPHTLGVLDVWHLERELKRAFGEEKKDVVEAFKVLALEGKGEGNSSAVNGGGYKGEGG